jgi:hypothetical protein
MKRMSLIVLVVSLLIIMINSASGSIVWKGGDGNFNDPCMWDKGYVPVNDGDEIKVSKLGTCTINTTLLDYSANKSAISDGSTILLADGGWIGIKEHKIGDSGAGGADDGYMIQTGGTITTSVGGKIEIGYKEAGYGEYTISGGNLGVSGDGLRVFVGTGASSGVAEGLLTIDGTGGTITLDDLWVASRDSSGTVPGTGIVEFKLDSGGVSPITVEGASANIDVTDIEEAVAILKISPRYHAPPEADIPLIVGTVNGEFDTISDSKPGVVAATEGAEVYVEFAGYYYVYTLTYAGSVELIYDRTEVIPEPATVALFGLGLIAVIRRPRKK